MLVPYSAVSSQILQQRDGQRAWRAVKVALVSGDERDNESEQTSAKQYLRRRELENTLVLFEHTNLPADWICLRHLQLARKERPGVRTHSDQDKTILNKLECRHLVFSIPEKTLYDLHDTRRSLLDTIDGM